MWGVEHSCLLFVQRGSSVESCPVDAVNSSIKLPGRPLPNPDWSAYSYSWKLHVLKTFLEISGN